MSKLDFFHGHVHTEQGSLLDGAIKVIELPKLAKEYGMSAISITDHGSLAGTLEFYRECKKAGIKPVCGIEAYLTLDDDGLDKEQMTRDNYHIILYASNEIGWKNLLWLSANAFKNNFYYKPRISIKNLKDHANGIIASSGCLSSICSRSATFDSINNVYRDNDGASHRWIQTLREIFQGRFYLELMQSSTKEQCAYNDYLIKVAKDTGIKNVITADAHYSRREDEPLHEMLMAMQSKNTIDEYRKDGYFRYENCYIRPPEEMLNAAITVGCEEAFHNTLEIPSLVNLEFELGKYKLPVFDITTDPDYKEFKECIHD